ncbi:MAG: TonB family protein [Novosphingobium sp.]|nr:TonB family protein [Novosphingobium sp.]
MSELIDDDDFNPYPPARTKLGVILFVALLHVVVLLGLVRAFAPDFTAKAVEKVLSTFTVTITAPPPPPSAEQPKAAGDTGEAGKKAVAKETKAPPAKIPIAKSPAPKASSTGSAVTSGATNQGNGTGAAGQGSGTGAGGTGNGQGGGQASKAAHISGQINNAKDFPIPAGGREARIGKSVILALTVAPSGRATNCRVYKSSGFPETDAAACVLAMQRLKFKPATNSAGEPITSTFYWQQKFFF